MSSTKIDLTPLYRRLDLTINGQHYDGRNVAIGLGIATTTTVGLLAIKKYFAGGWCHLTKDLTNKNVVITGGNGGIGKETARRLVQLGATVFIGSRDVNRNNQTVQELNKIGKGKAIAFKLDLGDRNSIQQFVQNVNRQLGDQPLHYLVNNAGVMALPELKKTKDGNQFQIGINHFGHFYLTYLFWPKLKASGNPRILNLSSKAHEFSGKNYDIDFSNINFQSGGYHPWAAYTRSKRANILFAKQLQRRMKQEGIQGLAVSLHPGAVRTDLMSNFLDNPLKRILYNIILLPLQYLLFKSAEEGAQTTLYCLLEDEKNLGQGGYYRDCRLVQTGANQVESLPVAKRLWEESQKNYGIQFKL